MMKQIKTFLTDMVYTFFYYAYLGLVIVSHSVGIVIDTIYNFLVGFLLPTLGDIIAEVIRFLHYIHFETLNLLSYVFLKLSQLFTSLSRYFVEQAEEKSSKRVWF